MRYVGLTTRGIEDRWYAHTYSAMKGYEKSCPVFYRAIRKYGKENFIIHEIDKATTVEELRRKECEWIERLNTVVPNGYNLTGGAEGHVVWHEDSRARATAAQLKRNAPGPQVNPMFGRVHSQETKAVIGAKARERMSRPGSREYRSNKMKQFYADHPESRQKISERALKQMESGHKMLLQSKEVRAKIAETISTEAWKNKHSETMRAALSKPESLERIAAARTKEWKDRISKKLTGTKFSVERCAEISARQTGKKRGPYNIIKEVT